MNTFTGSRLFLARSLASLLLLLAALSFAAPAASAGCSSVIGCLTCGASSNDLRPRCIYEDSNGACDCTVTLTPDGAECDTSGSCVYSGWQGGPPPPV